MMVFSESIKYLKQTLLEEATKQQTDLSIDDIKWILTVPAIWSDPAKTFMRKAAVEVCYCTFCAICSLIFEAVSKCAGLFLLYSSNLFWRISEQ